jgi:biotin operon repressor
MVLIPIEFRKMKDQNGKDILKAGVSIAYASNKQTMDKISIVEQNFTKLQKTLQVKIKKTDKNENVFDHWEIGDDVYRFYEETEAAGFQLEFKTAMLAESVGMSMEFWYRHLKFRKIYPTKDSVNKNISWSMYIEILKIQDDVKRKAMESQIADGKITHPTELRLLKSKNVLSKTHSTILNELKKSAQTKEEIAAATGINKASITKRISDLRHLGYDVACIDGKYSLGVKMVPRSDKKSETERPAGRQRCCAYCGKPATVSVQILDKAEVVCNNDCAKKLIDKYEGLCFNKIAELKKRKLELENGVE